MWEDSSDGGFIADNRDFTRSFYLRLSGCSGEQIKTIFPDAETLKRDGAPTDEYAFIAYSITEYALREKLTDKKILSVMPVME
jgi:hypothetical protein